jgi:hypothetical protein
MPTMKTFESTSIAEYLHTAYPSSSAAGTELMPQAARLSAASATRAARSEVITDIGNPPQRAAIGATLCYLDSTRRTWFKMDLVLLHTS